MFGAYICQPTITALFDISRSTLYILQAGAQRMRSQKIMARYAMCVAGLSFDKNLAALRTAVNQFELVHNGLLEGSSDLFLPPATDPRVRWF